MATEWVSTNIVTSALIDGNWKTFLFFIIETIQMLSGTTFVLRVGFWKASINVKEEQKNIFVLFGKLDEDWTDFTKFCSSDFRYSMYECLITKFTTICNIINPKSDRPCVAA